MNETESTTRVEAAEAVEPRVTRRAARTKRSGALWAGVAVLVLAGAAGAAYYAGVLPGNLGKVTEGTGDGAMVATVNGSDISRTELDEKVQDVVSQYGMSPEQSKDAAFELQVLDEIINLRLLVSEAEKQGVTVSDDDVTGELTKLIDAMGGQEVFTSQLTALGMTEEELRTNMRNELVIRKLLDANTDIENITVSDEEIAAMYEEATAMAPEGQEIPPLEEVGEMARAQLIQQKSAEIVTAYIEQLRAAANIKITL